MSLIHSYGRLGEVSRSAEQHIRLSAAQAGGHPGFADANYRWQHTQRVTQYGMQIAQAEDANLELVAAACLLHDTEWFVDIEQDKHGHGRLAARTFRPFLEQIGYSPDEVDNICYSVAVHVDGDAGYQHEHTLEAKVVSDADNVDRFGALRAIFYCLDTLDDYEALISKLKVRLERLADYRSRQVMETPAGNRLFNQQLDLQMDFFKKLVAEHEITRLPDL